MHKFSIRFIIEANDSGELGWAIERHMDTIPTSSKANFQKILLDTKTRKDNLERS